MAKHSFGVAFGAATVCIALMAAAPSGHFLSSFGHNVVPQSSSSEQWKFEEWSVKATEKWRGIRVTSQEFKELDHLGMLRYSFGFSETMIFWSFLKDYCRQRISEIDDRQMQILWLDQCSFYLKEKSRMEYSIARLSKAVSTFYDRLEEYVSKQKPDFIESFPQSCPAAWSVMAGGLLEARTFVSNWLNEDSYISYGAVAVVATIQSYHDSGKISDSSPIEEFLSLLSIATLQVEEYSQLLGGYVKFVNAWKSGDECPTVIEIGVEPETKRKEPVGPSI